MITYAPSHAVIGIIMLDTQFPRPLGDVGHPETFGVTTHREFVKGVWPEHVVTTAAGLRKARMVVGFQSLVRVLQGRGVKAITTSCGFLVLLQKELQLVAKIPVVSSSLLQLPKALDRDEQVGVITISANALGQEHLRAAGVPKDRVKDVIVQGMPRDSHFARQILGNQSTLDLTLAESEVVTAAFALKARAPHLKTVVLECTNMPPYHLAIEAATGWQLLSLKTDPRLRKVIDATQAPSTSTASSSQ